MRIGSLIIWESTKWGDPVVSNEILLKTVLELDNNESFFIKIILLKGEYVL